MYCNDLNLLILLPSTFLQVIENNMQGPCTSGTIAARVTGCLHKKSSQEPSIWSENIADPQIVIEGKIEDPR